MTGAGQSRPVFFGAYAMQTPLYIFANAFEPRTRDDGSTFWTTRDDAPEWVSDIVRDAHDGAFPCDWRYDKIADLAHDIGQAADPDDIDATEWADRAADVYNADLIRWLSIAGAVDAVDMAAEEWGMDTRGVMQSIVTGQCYMLYQIASGVLYALRERYDDFLQHEAELTGADA
jgi:hypothetical protein